MKVLAFGAARDIIGESEINFVLSSDTTVKTFKEELYTMYPSLKKLNAIAIAVNEVYASDEIVIGKLDVIALIPPVSGG
ncbi:MAG: molybdopterin converting factor subunit 1 [bacterium]|jgi:molybdopterin converting factor subunit 1